jgi:hypothetical protein
MNTLETYADGMRGGSGGARRSGARNALKSLGGARMRTPGRSGGGAAELERYTLETLRLFGAEQERRSSGAAPYKRGGLLRSLLAAPLSSEDSIGTQASDVCLVSGRRLGIHHGRRRAVRRRYLIGTYAGRCSVG